MSAEHRWGKDAAKTAHVPPLSVSPKRMARSEPAASSTAPTSSSVVSMSGSRPTRSARPVPRLSNQITRANVASLRRKRAAGGYSQKHLQVGGEPSDPHEVLVALAELRVREIGPGTRLRVSSLRDHDRSLPRSWPACLKGCLPKRLPPGPTDRLTCAARRRHTAPTVEALARWVPDEDEPRIGICPSPHASGHS